MKRILSLFLSMMLILSMSVSFAEGTESQSIFNDLSKDHWAYDAIKQMVENNVLSGYPDGTFRPEAKVSRAEFAKLMVKALNLPIDENAKSSFVDVDDSHWVVPYLEAAKQYLTGYQALSGIKYKPDEPALREDMAVALVNALKLPLTSTEPLNTYTDKSSISTQLRAHVATAISNNLIKGYEKDGVKTFKPLGELTRAEAAKLLLNVIVEEKIILPTEEKVILDDSGNFVVKGSVNENGILLQWSISDLEGIQGFKIVASKNNSNPRYPESGYYTYLRDTSLRTYLIDGKSYNSGDFGSFEAGEDYYFSVTAIYDDKKVAGNSVRLTYPGATAPVVTEPVATVSDLKLTLVSDDDYLEFEWTKVPQDQLKYYKVVASKSDSTPMYPDNGYQTYMSDSDDNDIKIMSGMSYNGGDIGKFSAGESYYFAITAVMKDGSKVTSNAIKATVPGDELVIVKDTIVLKAFESDGKLVLEWTASKRGDFRGYKVVASKTDDTPAYPDNGYYKYITNIGTSRVEIPVGAGYNNGFDSFEAGDYYFAITTLYEDGQKDISNTVIGTVK